MGWNDLIGTPFGDEAQQYIIEEEIARGGMSRVFRAHEVPDNRLVALKVMALGSDGGGDTRTFTRRFEHEARAVERLDHPNIVKVFNTGGTDEFVYIAMQLVLGGTFRQRLGRPMPIPDACFQMIQMAKALHHAHMHHVIHRDVKPANMLIDDLDPSHLLLADFGIAKIMGQKGVTKTGTAVGTPEYMAPEQAKGEEIDQRADIYGLACVLYEALAGRPPFVGPTALSICYQHVHTRPAYIRGFNPEVPRGLALVIEQALAKNPRDRYNTAEDFANALYPFTESVGRGPRPSTPLVDFNVRSLADEDDPDLQESSSEHTNDVEAFSMPPGIPLDVSSATVPLADASAMLDLSSLGSRQSMLNSPEEDATTRQTQEMAPVSQPARPRHTRPVQPGLRLKSRPITRPRESESGSYPPFDTSDPTRLSTIQTPVTPLPQAKIVVQQRSPSSSFSERFPQPSRQRMIILISAALIVALLTFVLVTHLHPSAATGSTSTVVQPTATTAPIIVPTHASTTVPTIVPTLQPTTPVQPTGTPSFNPAAIVTAATVTNQSDTSCLASKDLTSIPANTAYYINACVAPGYPPGTLSLNVLNKGINQQGLVRGSIREGGHSYQFNPLLPGVYTIVVAWNGYIARQFSLTVN